VKSDNRAVFALKGIYSFAYNSITPILPAFLTTFTSSAAQISLVPASYQFSRVLGALFFGHASDRFGHKRAILAAVGIAIVMLASLLLARTISDFALIYFCIGISSGIFYISLDALATTLHGQKGRALAWMEVAYHIGFLAGPFLGGWLAHQYGMNAVFVLSALLMAIAFFPILLLKDTERKARVSFHSTLLEMASIRQAVPGRNLFSFALSTLVNGFCETSLWLIMPLYATFLGYDLASVGLLTAIAAAITVLGVGPLGSFSDSMGRRASLLLSFGLILIASILLTFFHSFEAMALLAGVFALGRSAGYVNTRAYSADLASHEHRASVLSVQELLFTLGRTIGPLAAGLMLDGFGVVFAFQAIAFIVAANMVVLVALPKIDANKKS